MPVSSFCAQGIHRVLGRAPIFEERNEGFSGLDLAMERCLSHSCKWN